MNIQDDKRNEFAEDFIKNYSNAGFGSMNKNEFEVLIFDLLRKYGNLKDKSTYEISIDLQIPETKVKRLAYEADLKYKSSDNRQYVKEQFFKLIAKADFKSVGEKICFIVEDKYIKNAIGADLRENGYLYDTSFNKDILSIPLDAFVDLLNMYYPSDAIKRIVKECKKHINSQKPDNITFKSIIKDFLKGAMNKVGELTSSTVFTLITGGISTQTELIETITKYLNKE